MEIFYEKTWGWSDSGKRAELKEETALYLIGTKLFLSYIPIQID
jgi:hypothetical protein